MTISRHVRAVEAELAKEFREEVECFRARETLVMEHVAQQALAGWERSTRGDQDGNPRFLAEARRARAEIRKLWALDIPRPPVAPSPASTPSTPSTPSGGPDYDRVIYEVHTLPGTYEEPERGITTAFPADPSGRAGQSPISQSLISPCTPTYPHTHTPPPLPILTPPPLAAPRWLCGELQSRGPPGSLRPRSPLSC